MPHTEPYSEATKARALALIAAGEPLLRVQEETGVNRKTLGEWKRVYDLQATQRKALTPSRQESLGDQLYQMVENSLGAINSQLALFGDPEWLRSQSAADLTALYKTINEKVIRLLSAFATDNDEPGDGAGWEPGGGLGAEDIVEATYNARE